MSQDAVPSLSADEFSGIGGEYLLNPKTGKRTLIARTEPATNQPVPTDAPADAQADDPS